MGTRIDTECSQCGKTICLGDDYICSDLVEGRLFCCEKCLKDYIMDDPDLMEKVLDDWLPENADYYTMESEDPYDRYGVSEEDFV